MSDSTYSPAPRGRWSAPTATGPIQATLRIPGSKSLTNRELLLAAIADGSSVVRAPLHSEDSARMIDALRTLGIGIEEEPGSNGFGPDLRISPAPLQGGGTVDCGQAGTVMRFVAPLAGLAHGDVLLTAHETALHRPMGAMIHALRDLGVDIEDGGSWALPFTIRGLGHIRGGRIEIDASASSQFVSGLLLAAARFDVGLHLVHTGDRLPSMPHIDMTIEALVRRGIKVERPGAGEWLVQAGIPRAIDVTIEPDLSNAAPFLGAALVQGGAVSIAGWPSRSTQPGALLPSLLTRLGGHVVQAGDVLTVHGDGSVRGAELDLAAAGELAPTFVGLAALADGPTTITGIGHIRLHETDRIAALAGNLRALGGDVEELADGLRIIPSPLRGGTWPAHHDHRMATTGALIGLRAPGVEIDEIGTTAKTLPEFTQLWDEMLDPLPSSSRSATA
ncbi:3-phosphoshikimate 1-carboxyvinyltransferase [uncultured Microbacterium sp.]|uniref:3-phosphoshikimate 1-carboxyvinyltransferase n=1 Tax=uncultured Microbacterium sp. TaxID=191216 RepID=UPI0025E09F8E|nr:3-phosphoshikimate 1-carboxyvinyltransferase [uncultured Microbacterium sp.]